MFGDSYMGFDFWVFYYVDFAICIFLKFFWTSVLANWSGFLIPFLYLFGSGKDSDYRILIECKMSLSFHSSRLSKGKKELQCLILLVSPPFFFLKLGINWTELVFYFSFSQIVRSEMGFQIWKKKKKLWKLDLEFFLSIDNTSKNPFFTSTLLHQYKVHMWTGYQDMRAIQLTCPQLLPEKREGKREKKRKKKNYHVLYIFL